MTLNFIIPRFSGSTLEPSSEPIVLYESQYYEKDAGRALHIQLIPTRSTPPLKRAFKPPHIIIPEPDFDSMRIDNEEFSPWSYESADASTGMLLDSATSSDSTTKA